MNPERQAQIASVYRERMQGQATDFHPDRNPDILAARESLLRMGFRIVTTTGGPELYWDGREPDFARVERVIDLIMATKNYADEVYALYVLPQIRSILEGRGAETTSIFHHLDDPITRKLAKGHSGDETPFAHSFAVSAMARTSRDQDLRVIQRVANIFHDVGKVFLVPGDRDEQTLHAEISYLFLVSYFRSRGERAEFSEDQRHVLLQTVRFHHILEQIERGILRRDDPALLELFSNSQIARSIARLTNADTASVAGYERFRVEAMSSFLLIMAALRDEGKEVGNEIIHFIKVNIVAVFELLRQILDDVRQDAQKVHQTIDRFLEAMRLELVTSLGVNVPEFILSPMPRD